MGAQVDERHAPRPHRVHEAHRGHAARPQPVGGAAAQVAAADPVHHHPHRHAPGVGRQQRVDEPAADRVVVEQVGAQQDRPLGALDRRQHDRIGAVAVLEPAQGVAAEQRPAGEAPDRLGQQRVLPVQLPLAGGHAVPAGPPPRPTQPARQPPHPVDAEHRVERGADQRRQPGQADPADRRADVALGAQHVQRDQHRQHQPRRPQQVPQQHPGRAGHGLVTKW